MESRPNYDTVLAHGSVFAIDADLNLILDGAVAFSGNQIAAVGSTAEMLTDADAGGVVDCSAHVILRG